MAVAAAEKSLHVERESARRSTALSTGSIVAQLNKPLLGFELYLVRVLGALHSDRKNDRKRVTFRLRWTGEHEEHDT